MVWMFQDTILYLENYGFDFLHKPPFNLQYLIELIVLSERLKEEPKLSKLEVIWSVLVISIGLIFGEVEGLVHGSLAVEQILVSGDVKDSSVNLGNKIKLQGDFL